MCVPMPHGLTGRQRAPVCAMCVKCVSPLCANYKSYKPLIHIHIVECVSCVSGFLFCGWYIHMIFCVYQGVFTMILEKTKTKEKLDTLGTQLILLRKSWHTCGTHQDTQPQTRHTKAMARPSPLGVVSRLYHSFICKEYI